MDLSVFSSSLNASQLEAVTYCDGPSLVIAGAGSGKTRVLTYKIAYLLQNGYEPWSILALTFTNKAAREMNERIAMICAEQNANDLWSGTFHSLFARLLRMEHEYIDYPADFSIYDSGDSKSLIKTIIKEFGLDDKKYKPNLIANRISEAKNHLILPGQYANDASIQRRDYTEGIEQTHKIYTVYQQRLKAAAAMDFDDLLLNTFLLLRDNEEVRERYKQRFSYILVDEYQDTNMAQHRILSLLTNKESRICVVGDDAQSIYGFRGADISNILNFQQQYPTARLIKLECNYRSTQCIVEAANSIIKNNRNQIPKKVYASGEFGEKILVFDSQTDKEEAQKVARHIIKLKQQKGTDYNDIALLYRTNAQSRSFEETFQSYNIPYRIYGGLSFYQRKEIKDVLAYLRLVVNTDDEEAFKRIVNYPARGIGNTTLQKLHIAAINGNTSLWEVACNPEVFGIKLAPAARKKLATFCEMILTFREKSEKSTASTITREIITKSGIAADISAEKSAESISRQENIDEFLGSIQSYEKDIYESESRKYVSLAEFLATVSLLTDTEDNNDNQPKVTLMTIHSAKGLEYDAVFITGLEEDLFPNANARVYPKELEEERRLFYVAVTRAKRFCYLSYAHSRYRYGQFQFCDPSPFIDEIDEQYLQRTDRPRQISASNSTQRESLSSRRDSFVQKNSYGGFDKARHFDDFFGSPNEDDFRSDMQGKRESNNYDNSYNDYNRYRKEPYFPKSVAPVPPPLGFKRVNRCSANTTNANSSIKTDQLKPGIRIKHERFGSGTLIGTEGTGENAKIRVEFDDAGIKNLLVKFARFTILG